MNRKEANKFVHRFVHGAVKFGKRRQVLSDFGHLSGVFFQKSLGNNVFNIFLYNEELLKAVFHSPQNISYE